MNGKHTDSLKKPHVVIQHYYLGVALLRFRKSSDINGKNLPAQSSPALPVQTSNFEFSLKTTLKRIIRKKPIIDR